MAAQLRRPRVRVHTARVRAHPYDRPALTTAGRYLVCGTAADEDGQTRNYAFFSNLSRPGEVTAVHGGARAAALAAGTADALADRAGDLPERSGSTPAPRAQPSPRPPPHRPRRRVSSHLARPRAGAPCPVGRRTPPARRLPTGTIRGNPSVAHLAAEVPIGRTARRFAEHWLAVNVVPELTAEDLWRQPHVAATFDAHLRDRILRAATALPTLVDELESLTTATAHGDACTDNLLPRHPVDPLRAPDRWSGTRTAPTLREPRRHGPLRTRPPGRHDSAPRSPLSSPPSRHRR